MVRRATYNTLHDVLYFTVLMAFIHCERSQQQYLHFFQYTKTVLAKAQQEMEYRNVIALFCQFFLSCLCRLGSHLSPSGTECYITMDMFYVEVQLDTSGQLVDVKVAHQGESPTVSLITM